MSDYDDGGLRNAAAALSVSSGSWHEPWTHAGLAHFLEHMVFMGSKKYPDENKFDNYISARNGWSNAYTDQEVTLYYYEVKPESLNTSLDIWSRFFIDPLMKEDSVNREVQAVDSEFQIAQSKDSNRIFGMFIKLAKKGHPAGKFSWGNILSLKKTRDIEASSKELYDALITLHKKYYSPKIMNLSVRSAHSLDRLQAMVLEKFSDMPTHPEFVEPTSVNQEYINDLSIWEDSMEGKLFEVVPVGDSIQLQMYWQLPETLSRWKCDPSSYLDWLIGHEGKGSIFNYLQENQLCTSLSAGVDPYGDTYNCLFTQFKIEMTITEKGLKNLDLIRNTVFSYLQMLRKTGVNKDIYDQIKKINKINWETEELKEPSDHVMEITEHMRKYRSEPEHWLDAEALNHEFDENLIMNCIEHMTPSRAITILLDPKFRDDEKSFTETDDWFGTKWRTSDHEYRFEELESKLFHYPGENPYLTDDLALVTVETEKSDLPQEYKNGRNDVRLFVKPDFTFKLPKAHYTLLLRADAYFFQSDPEISAYCNVLPNAAMLALSSELYDANVASLSYSIKCDSAGLSIDVRGISKTCPKLLNRLVNFFKNIDKMDEKYFIMAKNKKIKDIRSRLLDSRAVATEVRLLYLERDKSDALSVLKILESDVCSFGGMKEFVENIFNNSFVDMLIQGNVNKSQAEKFFEETIAAIRTDQPKQMLHKGIQTRKVLKNEVVALKSFNATCYQKKIKNFDFEINFFDNLGIQDRKTTTTSLNTTKSDQ